MDDKIIKFNSVRQKQIDEKIPVIDMGTIYLDLLISCDGKNIYFRPSFELEDGLHEELLDEFSNMLKKGFSEAIDQLFNLYKTSK